MKNKSVNISLLMDRAIRAIRQTEGSMYLDVCIDGGLNVGLENDIREGLSCGYSEEEAVGFAIHRAFDRHEELVEATVREGVHAALQKALSGFSSHAADRSAFLFVFKKEGELKYGALTDRQVDGLRKSSEA